MAKKLFFLAVCLILLALVLAFKSGLDKAVKSSRPDEAATELLLPENKIGEKIIYDIKLRKIHLGESSFLRLDNQELNGKTVNVMVFQTRLVHFADKEVIYTDPQTLLPLRVERDITNLVLKEKITEDYNQDEFTVTISKKKTIGFNEQFVIKKDGQINNAILMPQYVRRLAELSIGKEFVANLPTRQVTIKLTSIDEIKVPAGTFKAYHFESFPRQIEIWISADQRRIPIKIQDSGKFGYTLLLKEYTPS